jgi:hypothetical protein
MATASEADEGSVGWTISDSDAAKSEGWNVCRRYGSDEYQLCRNDDSSIFIESDLQVWQHVTDEALKGSDLHRRAIAFIARYSPEEYRALVRMFPKAGPSAFAPAALGGA